MNQPEQIELEMPALNSSTSLPNQVKSKEFTKPRWFSLEFKFYYLVIACSLIAMIRETLFISSDKHEGYDKFSFRLSEGWIFGWKVDTSDQQYNSFRSRSVIILLLSIVHLILSRMSSLISPSNRTHGLRSIFTIPKLTFSLIFSLILIFGLHGYDSLKILTLLSINYQIAKLFRRHRINPIATWIFNMLSLILAVAFSEYKFINLSESLKFMDEFKGILPRWHIHYNISTLRLISFNLDFYWSNPISTLPNPTLATTKQRVKSQLDPKDYNFINYLAYVLYPPLYLAGPIITFQDFMYQIKYGNPTITLKKTLIYALRFLGCALLMELMLHTLYVQAISKSNEFDTYTPFQLVLIGFFNLKFIWLKLLIIWRFFRLWAMADGVDTIENMGRCMTNNYSIQGFWKGWHCSYNRWLVRYIYIPLGGSRLAFLNTWVIFTFVAVWHDPELKLLAWGWLISLFFIPEMIAAKSSSKFKNESYYRHLRSLGGTVNVVMLMVANLIGFALGLDGMAKLLNQLATLQGLALTSLCLLVVFTAVQIMVEIREHEKRQIKTIKS